MNDDHRAMQGRGDGGGAGQRRRSRARAAAVLLALLVGVFGWLPSAPASAATPGPSTAPEYWFDSWGVPGIWASGARGQGVTIAEIDTGVTASLPELRGRILPGKDFGSGGGDGQVDREVNAFGHGTAMASIMLARPGLLGITGLAPGAKILPIAVPLTGTTDANQSDQLPAAIRYAADHGAKIISLSLGGKQNERYDNTPCPAVEQAAVFHAISKGAVVVAAVGNTGPTANTVEEPAACLGVVSVGAVDRSGTVANFSAREPYLSLVAPGVNIPSLGRVAGDAFAGDGTSQATALVSASLALAWSAQPALSGQQLVTRLLATLDRHRSTPSSAYGYGLLNAQRLVTQVVPADAPNPVYSAAAPFRARAQALDSPAAPSVAPAATGPGGFDGTYAVGRAPRVTPQVRLGLAMCALGLIAVLALLEFRRRTRA